ncbi:MAG: 6-hydroxymethyl-7,8-dihydropterin pyrophosphokinase [Candidatus Thorarchaeota archaeon AB_25]|nr:MAG: 6-hydroxymethyl-7,8-dihydropterin pyrophosphokinase [Candidatus Thorarchaeota archaeon AB_25]
MLESIDPAPLLKRLSDCISGSQVIVCGAGPSLKQHMESLMKSDDFIDSVIVVADGAFSVILELGLHCDVVVTDLDGNLDHLREVKENGALVIVHAHGDNIEHVKSIVPSLGDILGSTQVEPTDRAFLWGGFTDGDRACHMVIEYSPERITFAGMDFGTTVGRWSKPGHEYHFPASERKRIKLEIAEELISSLLRRTRIDHLFLT